MAEVTPERRRAQLRESSRRYRERHPERARAKARRYAERNREKQQAWYQANRDQQRARQRQQYAAMGSFARRYRRHGVDAAKWSDLWTAQDGLCFLCGGELDPDKSIIEHWHGCTAGHVPNQSCDVCRRGIACRRCNTVIGQVNDDTTLLRAIAARLDVVQASVVARQAAAPIQVSLFD